MKIIHSVEIPLPCSPTEMTAWLQQIADSSMPLFMNGEINFNRNSKMLTLKWEEVDAI